MSKARASVIIIAMLLISGSSLAQSPDQVIQAENELKKYVNHLVHQVKSEDDPAKKRLILNESLDNLTGAVKSVQKITGLTGDDKEFLNSFLTDIQEKQDELNGVNGFSQVQDSDLNDFADYMQQDLEQARRVITISLTSALVIALIIFLLAS